MAVATELVTKFSFMGNLSPLTNFNETLTQSISLVAKAGAGLIASSGAVGLFVSNQMDAIDSLNDLSKETGVAVEKIQELGYVAQLSGSSAEGLQATISALTAKIGLASRGGEFELKKLSNEFEQLGINVKDSQGGLKSADTLLVDLQKSFEKLDLSQQEKAGFLAKLGIDKSMIQMLSLTSEEMNQLVEESRMFGQITTEQAETAAEFNDSLDRVKMAFSALSAQLALSFAPKISETIQAFMKLLVANKELIQNGLKKVFEVISSVIGAIINVVYVMFKAIDNSIGWKNALMLLAGAWLYLNKAILLSPVAWFLGIIATLVLIIDDLVVAFEGGQSAIREWAQEFLGIDIVPYLQEMVKEFKLAFEVILPTIFNKLKDMMKGLWEGIVSFFTFDWLVDGIKKTIDEAMLLIKPLIDTYNSVMGNDVSIAQPVEGINNQSLSSPITTNNQLATTNQTVNQEIKIDVKATDLKQGGYLATSIEDTYKQASKQFGGLNQ